MPAHDHPSPSIQPAKRQRQTSLEPTSPHSNGQPSPTDNLADVGAAPGKAGQSSNFRNVSACNRCRLRKNRCDQRLPSCASCAKAGVACVGYDPITKKEIPRSYVFYLETRITQLESILISKDISYPPADNLELCSRPGAEAEAVSSSTGYAQKTDAGDDQSLVRPQSQAVEALKHRSYKSGPGMLNIVSPSKPRSLASASGVSFARVVFAAVQYSVSDQNSAERPGSRHPSGSGTSMRDSFFGLHTKPTIKPAPFPERTVGLRLVTLYFEHANPQIPILHRGEFMQMFEQAYAEPQVRGPRELYMLNMVFAIGCGVIVGEPVKSEGSGGTKMVIDQPKNQNQPEEYHASAIVHLEACLSNSGGGLEVLQAVLLLANFALLRPVPPGLWYIIGVAVRLAVDLGLHYEEGGDLDPESLPDADEREDAGRGKRFWKRDLKRRLWWCTYSFDRLVSTCVGRPFGISDQVITTELPSLLDDEFITPAGFVQPPDDDLPSYKHVAHHYFRLRMLQSEILQVLQYNQAQISRAMGQGKMYPEMHTHLPSPFLVRFDSFRSWRLDINQRLYEWKTSAPTKEETGVAFSTEFLELNYWQAIILLYRQSLSVPALFEGEYNTSNEVNSPNAYTAELREDEDEIYRKVAEAGQKILRIYRQLHLSGLVSYTYLSTHHLFMAGISYLYAIWHSPTVRSHLTMDDVDFTILAAKSIFSDMIDKCPPAETCRDAFDRTAKATIKMANSKGGFGIPVQPRRPIRRETSNWSGAPDSKHHSRRPPKGEQQPFQFDLSLSDSLSSPSLSTTAEMGGQGSPPLNKSQGFDSDGYMVRRRDAPIDPTLVASPPTARRIPPQATGNAYLGQQFGLQGSVDYPDAQTMEFMQNVGATPNGDFGAVDAGQMDFGFGGLGWEGFSADFGDGQQMNPFDTFFFGGQQGSGGGGL